MIKGTIAEQTVKVLRGVHLMTWEIFTFFILKKFVTHVSSSLNITLIPIPAAFGPV